VKNIGSLLFLALFLIVSSGLNAQDSASTPRQDLPDFSYNKEDPASLKKAFELYQQELPKSPADYAARLKASDVVYYLSHHLSDKEEKRRILSQGIDWAKQAIDLRPGEAGGHLFYGILTGLKAEVSGIITGLKSKDIIKREMEKVIEIDPNYSDGDAYLALGQWYALVPFFLGGSDEKAKENLEKAKAINPKRSMPYIALAEFYFGKRQYDPALKEIEALLTMPTEEKYSFESRRDKAKASDLKKKIENRLATPQRGYQQPKSAASSFTPPTAP